MSVLDEVRGAVRGDVFADGSDGFDDAVRAFNTAVQHDAEIVVVAADADDVATAVVAARRAGLPVLTQSSGHGPLRPTARGLLIRTSRLKAVEIDLDRGTARIGAGALWGDVLDTCAEKKMAPLGMASVASVGVAGYLLGGGMGPLGRRDGFGADHVLAVEIVDAEGAARTVDAEHDPDLFASLRGGKFVPAVATAFTVRLAPEPQLFTGTLTYDRADVPAALAAYATWQQELPDVSTAIASVLRFPDLPHLPPPLRGKRFLQIEFVHAGDETSGRSALDRLTDACPPATNTTRVTTPASWMRAQMAPPAGPSLQLGMLVNGLDAEVAGVIVDAAGPETDAPWQIVEIRPFGGALGRPAPSHDLVGGRSDGVLVSVVTPTPNGSDGLRDRFAELQSRLERWYVPGVNVAFHGPDDPQRPVRDAWPDDMRQRLAAVRATYDPTGVFPAPR